MEHIILYGSKYGSTRRYAEKLSERTGLPAVSYKNTPDLFDKKTIVYLSGLYAGGVLGVTKTLRDFPFQKDQKLILVTVGLADPNEPENQDNICASLQKRLPAKLLDQAKIYHLRGGIDYQKLSLGHRAVMKLLYHSLCKTPFEQQTAENQALIETYGKRVDFTDFSTLEPIVHEILR